MRALLLGAVLVLSAAAVGCGSDGAEAGRQSTEDWASGFCAVFDGYFSSTEQQVGELELVEGPLGERLEDGLSLARGQVALLLVTADAVDALVPGAGRLDEFQAEVSAALRVDAERMQRFVGEAPKTTDELQALLAVGSTLGDGAIEVMRASEALDDEGFFALVDDPVCARWS
jgi:hypothetical protein